jgi:hypothetical protein
MNEEQKDFWRKVIYPKLIEMAIDCTLPTDMTEMCWGMFEEEAEEYNANKEVEKTIAETHAQLEYIQKLHIIGACSDEYCPTCNPKQYPFNEGDDYWTIEGGKVTWSCWDDVSEVIHDNESRRIYFSTEQEAINHLKN